MAPRLKRPLQIDLVIVANGLAPQIPLGGKMELLS